MEYVLSQAGLQSNKQSGLEWPEFYTIPGAGWHIVFLEFMYGTSVFFGGVYKVDVLVRAIMMMSGLVIRTTCPQREALGSLSTKRGPWKVYKSKPNSHKVFNCISKIGH
jgi:hypothetical protein